MTRLVIEIGSSAAGAEDMSAGAGSAGAGAVGCVGAGAGAGSAGAWARADQRASRAGFTGASSWPGGRRS